MPIPDQPPFLMRFHEVQYCYAGTGGGLAGCTLDIQRGSRNALLGANGSGKTTLLQHAIGLLTPRQGKIEFAGTPIDYSRKGLTALRSRVGLVFQNPDRQLFSASVQEDVSFGPMNLGLDPDTVRARVAAALATVGMAAQMEQPVHQLSFGQKKRVCIAGVLAMEPELLLLDEPMAGLDAAMQAELLEVLDKLSAQGITIILSTHDVDFAYRWADTLHLLDAGRCTASFPADELPRHGATLQAAGQPLPAVVKLHQALAGRGLMNPHVTPRSLDALLHTWAGEAAPGPGAGDCSPPPERKC